LALAVAFKEYSFMQTVAALLSIAASVLTIIVRMIDLSRFKKP
jgi:hypothetical protein